MENKLPERKPTRLPYYDYNNNGAYFLTICTRERKEILSQINSCSENVDLLEYGVIADKIIQQMNMFYDNVNIEAYVIMPNHIHVLAVVSEGGASRTSPPTRQHSVISRFVSNFKRLCNREYGENIWQRHFYDHIIRNREDYENHLRYISENPARWSYNLNNNA